MSKAEYAANSLLGKSSSDEKQSRPMPELESDPIENTVPTLTIDRDMVPGLADKAVGDTVELTVSATIKTTGDQIELDIDNIEEGSQPDMSETEKTNDELPL